MKILIGILCVLLLATTVSAEIVYPQEFYENEKMYKIERGWATAYQLQNTNILLMKQNDLLQEHNELTKTQNEILRRIYDVLIHTRGDGWNTPYPGVDVYYPPLEI